MTDDMLRAIIEAALLAAGRPLNLDNLLALFADDEPAVSRQALRRALEELSASYAGRGVELAEVAGGWRLQVRSEYAGRVARLWAERPARYSRALLETLALIAYRQPVTRGEIEDVRGVSVSTSIIKTLQEREWIRVLGHREVPGRPAMYGTTREFLDHFHLKSLEDLPPLAAVKDLDNLHDDLFKGLEAAEGIRSRPMADPSPGAPAGDTASGGDASSERPATLDEDDTRAAQRQRPVEN